MKPLLLSTKLFLASGLVLVMFCLASFGLLYRAQIQLSVREMDTFLENEALALSALVSAKPDGSFDFEMPVSFQSHYQQLNPSGFFRFIAAQGNQILRESLSAPPIDCKTAAQGATDATLGDHRTFRIRALVFRPEPDTEFKGVPTFESPPLCLVVGIDRAPYHALVRGTLLSTLPLLMGLVISLIGILLILVRSLTRDLSKLTTTLETADFGGTHAFPILPEAQTLEVKAVVEKLRSLHGQAANIYDDMWLFLARAAHQLKTPVTAMQATLQVLLRKERSKEELLVGLADVEAATHQLAGLTKKLISYSRISYQELPAMEPVDLSDFILEQLRIFRTKASERGISLQVSSNPSLKVLGHVALMADLFGNLIENAILYSPIRQAEREGAVISICWHIDGVRAVILVSDQGTGFPETVTQSLFKPFVRGDERLVAGSGLGLSIAKKSALLLGGDVEIQKTGPTGSVMIVTLPMSP